MSRLADDIDQESVASNEEDELDDLRFGGHYGQRKRRLQRKPRQHDAVGNQLGVGAVGAYTAPAASTTAEAKPVVINTSACKGPMMECVAEVLAKRQGCELIDDPSRKNDDLYIIMTRESLKMRIARMGRKSMVSKFPCMYNLCTNTVFSQCMEFALKMLPAPANPSDTYWPETFRIPAQMKQIEAAMKRAAQQHTGPKRAPPAWIVKPTLRGENNQGLVLDQIFITTHFDELEDRFMGKTLSCDWVCQRYVQNPLLIDGLKFDFRIFATVVSLDPLEIHISRNSVARFCTEPFQPVRPGKVLKGHDALMHVTSFHLNRVARNYKPATQTAFNDDTDSSKRPLATVLRQIRRRGKNDQYAGFSEKHFWEQIEEATAVAVTAMLPVLRVSYIRHFADARKGGRSHEEAFAGGCQAFQTIALDFVMQDTLHPVLVQVNNQPSMGLTPPPINDKGLMPNINAKAGASRVNVRSTGGVCPVDRVVKTAVFSGSLELLQVFQDPARQYAQINGGLKKALKVAEASAAAEAAEASPEKSSKNSKSTTGNINYFPVDMAKVAHLERCVKLVEMLYLKCGGIKKAFNPSVLKKELAKCSTMFHKKFTKPDLTIVMAPFRDNHRMVKEGASDEGFQEDIAVLAFANMMQQICCKTHRSEEHVLSRLVTILSEVCNPPAKGKKGRENVAAPVLSPAPPPPTIPFPAAATPPLPPPAGAAGAAASEAATSRRASDGPSRKPSRRASNLAALDRSASNIRYAAAPVCPPPSLAKLGSNPRNRCAHLAVGSSAVAMIDLPRTPPCHAMPPIPSPWYPDVTCSGASTPIMLCTAHDTATRARVHMCTCAFVALDGGKRALRHGARALPGRQTLIPLTRLR